MPYFIVNGRPVFLSEHAHASLRSEVLSDKDAAFRLASNIEGRPEGEIADRLMLDALRAQSKENPGDFEIGWYRFDLSGEEAQRNVWDLLYDYCDYMRVGWLSSGSSFEQTLMGSYSGESYDFPMGKSFLLNVAIRGRWFRKTTLSIRVLVTDVRRLHGTLTNFSIEGKKLDLRCGKEIEVSGSVYDELLDDDWD